MESNIRHFEYLLDETRQYKDLVHIALDDLYDLDFDLYNIALEIRKQTLLFACKLDKILEEK